MNNYKLFFTTFIEVASITTLFVAFNRQVKNKFTKSSIIILVLSLLVVLTNSLSTWLGTLINLSVLFFMFMLFFKKKTNELLMEYTFVLVIIIILEIAMNNINVGSYMPKIFNSEFMNTFLTNIIILVLCGCIYFLTSHKITIQIYIRRMNKLYFLLVSLLTYSFIVKLIWEQNKYIILRNTFIFILIPILLWALNLILIIYRESIIEHKKALETYNKYNPTILSLMDEIRRRQHDFKNHLTTIYGIVATYDENILRAELKNYLSSLQQSLEEIEEFMQLENKVLAAILYMKSNEAKQNNINFCFAIEDGTIKFPLKEYELSEVLNNLIDNAFESVMHMESNKKNVYLKITQNKNEKIIEISNTKPKTFSKNISSIFEKGFTTKKENGHGYGLYSIKKIIQSYKGKIVLSLEDNNVIFKITLFDTLPN